LKDGLRFIQSLHEAQDLCRFEVDIAKLEGGFSV
jgi:hypothetical protein